MVDTVNSDAKWVACAADDNCSQISRLREQFSELMAEFWKEDDREENAKMVLELVVWGHEWCFLDLRYLRFQERKRPCQEAEVGGS